MAVGQEAAEVWLWPSLPSASGVQEDGSESVASVRIQPLRVQAKPGDFGALLVNELLVKNISQSTPSADAFNTMTITLVARAGIKAGSRLVLSGLTGSATPDTPDMPVVSQVEVGGAQLSPNVTLNPDTSNSSMRVVQGIFNGKGDWKRQEGRFSVAVASYVLANVVYSLQFTLRNPDQGQKAPDVYIEITGPSFVPVKNP